MRILDNSEHSVFEKFYVNLNGFLTDEVEVMLRDFLSNPGFIITGTTTYERGQSENTRE